MISAGLPDLSEDLTCFKFLCRTFMALARFDYNFTPAALDILLSPFVVSVSFTSGKALSQINTNGGFQQDYTGSEPFG